MTTDGIIYKRRKGTFDDPFVPIQESTQIINGKAQLREVPDSFAKVRIIDDITLWKEVRELPVGLDEYYVDYPQSIVTVDISHNGKYFTFDYMGTGVAYYPASKIYLDVKSGIPTDSVKDTINSHQSQIDQLVVHGDSSPAAAQASVDKNGVSFATLKERIDAEQEKIDLAKTNAKNVTFNSMKDRLDDSDSRIGETSNLQTQKKTSLVDAINENVSLLAQNTTIVSITDNSDLDLSTELSKVSTSSKVKFPTGTALINKTTVKPSKDGLVIEGEGIKRTILKAKDVDLPTLEFPFSGKNNMILRNLTIDGDFKASEVDISGNYFTLQNVEIKQHKKRNVSLKGLVSKIENCRFYLLTPTDAGFTPECNVHLSFNANKFLDNHVVNHGQPNAILIDDSNLGVQTYTIIVERNTIENFSGAGIKVKGNSKEIVLDNNYFEGDDVTAIGMLIDGGRHQGVSICNNHFSDLGNSVVIEQPDRRSLFKIENNNFRRPGKLNLANYTVDPALNIRNMPEFFFKGNHHEQDDNVQTGSLILNNKYAFDYLECYHTKNVVNGEGYQNIRMGTLHTKTPGNTPTKIFDVFLDPVSGTAYNEGVIIEAKIRRKRHNYQQDGTTTVPSRDVEYIVNTVVASNDGTMRIAQDEKVHMSTKAVGTEYPKGLNEVSAKWVASGNILSLEVTGETNVDASIVNEWYVDLEIKRMKQ